MDDTDDEVRDLTARSFRSLSFPYEALEDSGSLKDSTPTPSRNHDNNHNNHHNNHHDNNNHDHNNHRSDRNEHGRDEGKLIDRKDDEDKESILNRWPTYVDLGWTSRDARRSTAKGEQGEVAAGVGAAGCQGPAGGALSVAVQQQQQEEGETGAAERVDISMMPGGEAITRVSASRHVTLTQRAAAMSSAPKRDAVLETLLLQQLQQHHHMHQQQKQQQQLQQHQQQQKQHHEQQQQRQQEQQQHQQQQQQKQQQAITFGTERKVTSFMSGMHVAESGEACHLKQLSHRQQHQQIYHHHEQQQQHNYHHQHQYHQHQQHIWRQCESQVELSAQAMSGHAKQASSILKNVISKKMQLEQELKMERGEVVDTSVPSECGDSRGRDDAARSAERRGQGRARVSVHPDVVRGGDGFAGRLASASANESSAGGEALRSSTSQKIFLQSENSAFTSWGQRRHEAAADPGGAARRDSRRQTIRLDIPHGGAGIVQDDDQKKKKKMMLKMMMKLPQTELAKRGYSSSSSSSLSTSEGVRNVPNDDDGADADSSCYLAVSAPVHALNSSSAMVVVVEGDARENKTKQKSQSLAQDAATGVFRSQDANRLLKVGDATRSGGAPVSRSPEIKISIRKRGGDTGAKPFSIAKLLTPNISGGGIDDGHHRHHDRHPTTHVASISASTAKPTPGFTLPAIFKIEPVDVAPSPARLEEKVKGQAPIHHVRDVRKLVKSCYPVGSREDHTDSRSTTSDHSSVGATAPTAAEGRGHSRGCDIAATNVTASSSSRGLKAAAPLVINCKSITRRERGDSNGDAVKARAADARVGAVTTPTMGGAPPEGPRGRGSAEEKGAQQRLGLKVGAADELVGRGGPAKPASQLAVEKLEAAVRSMEDLYVYENHEWRRRHGAEAPVPESHVLSLIACMEKGEKEKQAHAEGAATARIVRVQQQQQQQQQHQQQQQQRAAPLAAASVPPPSSRHVALGPSTWSAQKVAHKLPHIFGTTQTVAAAVSKRQQQQQQQQQGTVIRSVRPPCPARADEAGATAFAQQQQQQQQEQQQQQQQEEERERSAEAAAELGHYLTIPVKASARDGSGESSKEPQALLDPSPAVAPRTYREASSQQHAAQVDGKSQQQQHQQQRRHTHRAMNLDERGKRPEFGSGRTSAASVKNIHGLNSASGHFAQIHTTSAQQTCPPSPLILQPVHSAALAFSAASERDERRLPLLRAIAGSASPAAPVSHRRVLVDPESGQCYLVDAPPPALPQRKTLLDVETQQYVEVSVTPQAEGAGGVGGTAGGVYSVAMAPAQFLFTAATPGALGSHFVMFPGVLSTHIQAMPAGYEYQHQLQQQLQYQQLQYHQQQQQYFQHQGSSGLVEEPQSSQGKCFFQSGKEESSPAVDRPYFLPSGKVLGAGNQGVFAVPGSGGELELLKGPAAVSFCSAAQAQGPRIVAPPSFDGTTMSFVVEHS